MIFYGNYCTTMKPTWRHFKHGSRCWKHPPVKRERMLTKRKKTLRENPKNCNGRGHERKKSAPPSRRRCGRKNLTRSPPGRRKRKCRHPHSSVHNRPPRSRPSSPTTTVKRKPLYRASQNEKKESFPIPMRRRRKKKRKERRRSIKPPLSCPPEILRCHLWCQSVPLCSLPLRYGRLGYPHTLHDRLFPVLLLVGRRPRPTPPPSWSGCMPNCLAATDAPRHPVEHLRQSAPHPLKKRTNACPTPKGPWTLFPIRSLSFCIPHRRHRTTGMAPRKNDRARQGPFLFRRVGPPHRLGPCRVWRLRRPLLASPHQRETTGWRCSPRSGTPPPPPRIIPPLPPLPPPLESATRTLVSPWPGPPPSSPPRRHPSRPIGFCHGIPRWDASLPRAPPPSAWERRAGAKRRARRLHLLLPSPPLEEGEAALTLSRSMTRECC